MSSTLKEVQRVSGGEEEHGHLEEFRTDPIGLMQRIRDECGDVGWFQLADKQVVLLSGAEANEFFFRSSDSELNQAEAYPFMTPIFGEGVVFDADPERRAEMLHNTALRGEQMKGHASTIEGEVKKMIADWGDEGEIDLLEFFAELGVAGVAVYIGLTYLGFLDVRWTPLTLQAGLFCLLMAPEVYAPLRQFAAHYHDRATALAAVTQIAALFDGLPQDDGSGDRVETGVHAAPASRVAGAAVAVAGLGVQAPGRSRPVLSGAALALAPGEHVALMGPSGIGKSTLLEALARLRPAEGDIRIDGLPLAEWSEAALRERVVLIGQKPQLLAGSIADNIRLGRPDASDAELREAARRACVLEFAEALPQGLQTRLGGRGHGLSGGQAQRVALARLFLRDPGLILLDEPTAHLDEDTQARVLDEILAFSAGRSLLLATHAPAVAARLGRTLRVADAKVEDA